MKSQFGKIVRTTWIFFVVRFVCALAIGVLYILIAAGIQDFFVKVFGESTANYILGGVLSLFLGVLICRVLSMFAFMLIKGWHVAAIAYVPKIIKNKADPFDVGVRAFNKNLVSFGAVYGARQVMKSALSEFDDHLWELLKDVPYAQNLRAFATNPIVEMLARDILYYGFDAAIYYLVRFPVKDVNDVPAKLLEAIKKYLYCLPSIMLSSFSTFILYDVVPKVFHIVAVVTAFFSQGFVGGILITVLLWPAFYIVRISLLEPLTMITFISKFAKQCSGDPEKESAIMKYIENILAGDGVALSSFEQQGDDEAEDVEEHSVPAPTRSDRTHKSSVESQVIPTTLTDLDAGELASMASLIEGTSTDVPMAPKDDEMERRRRERRERRQREVEMMSSDSFTDIETLPLDGFGDSESILDVRKKFEQFQRNHSSGTVPSDIPAPSRKSSVEDVGAKVVSGSGTLTKSDPVNESVPTKVPSLVDIVVGGGQQAEGANTPEQRIQQGRQSLAELFSSMSQDDWDRDGVANNKLSSNDDSEMLSGGDFDD